MAHITMHVPPPQGLRFIDDDQTYWCVENVLHDSKDPTFFIVRLRHGKTEDCEDGMRVLAPTEYATLARERGFRALAPDVLQPTPAPPFGGG